MAEMPGMIRPDLQALPQVKDRMTFLYLELAQACGQMLDGTFPRIRGGDPTAAYPGSTDPKLFPARAGVIPWWSHPSPWPCPFPRTCGGDPLQDVVTEMEIDFSPHTRG